MAALNSGSSEKALEAPAPHRVPMDVDGGGKQHAGTLVERLLTQYFANQPNQSAGPRWRPAQSPRAGRLRWLTPTRPSCTIGAVGDVHAFETEGLGLPPCATSPLRR